LNESNTLVVHGSCQGDGGSRARPSARPRLQFLEGTAGSESFALPMRKPRVTRSRY
jgi:hypothetical protein